MTYNLFAGTLNVAQSISSFSVKQMQKLSNTNPIYPVISFTCKIDHLPNIFLTCMDGFFWHTTNYIFCAT